MKYIWAFIGSIFLPIFSLKHSIPKLCVNCKYFLPDKESDIYIYGTCSLFPILTKEEKQLQEYYYCSTSRNSENMCGKKAKYYKKKRLIKKYKQVKENV